ncbi:MAG: PLP-dependent aminotransferase family protein [Bdellovibrionota bacterium]
MKKYQKLALKLETDIAGGIFAPGEKLPSIRQLSKDTKLSINTVERALELLEGRGFISIKSQSGSFVKKENIRKNIPAEKWTYTPQTVKVDEFIRFLLELTSSVSSIPFGLGFLDTDFYPHRAVKKVATKLMREEPEVIGRYSHPPGEWAYRLSVSKYLAKHGTHISPNEIVATNGTIDGIMTALRAICVPGDTVLIEIPQFWTVLQIIETLKLKVVEVPAHPVTGIDLDKLRAAVKSGKVKAAVVMPNFNNPLGCIVSDAHKKEMVSILTSKDIAIIENDAYSDLVHNGKRPKSLKEFGDPSQIITCSTFSKTISPGLKIGWMAPGKYFDEIQRIQRSTSTGVSRLSQMIVARYLGTKEHERNLLQLRTECGKQLNRMGETVLKHFPKGTWISSPKGGLVLWIGLPMNVDGVELFRRSISRKIVVCPGDIFSASGYHKNHIRINCGLRWTPKIENALIELGNMVKDVSSEKGRKI